MGTNWHEFSRDDGASLFLEIGDHSWSKYFPEGYASEGLSVERGNIGMFLYIYLREICGHLRPFAGAQRICGILRWDLWKADWFARGERGNIGLFLYVYLRKICGHLRECATARADGATGPTFLSAVLSEFSPPCLRAQTGMSAPPRGPGRHLSTTAAHLKLVCRTMNLRNATGPWSPCTLRTARGTSGPAVPSRVGPVTSTSS